MNNNTNLKKAASKTAGLLSAVEKEEDIWKINWADLSIKQKMGQGNFGAVMKVPATDSKANFMGTEVAVKKFFEIDDDNYDMEKYVLREVAVLKSLHHPNIEGEPCLVTEFVKGGDLDNLLANESISLPWKTRLSIALEISLGLRYFASKNLVHRDLKAENFHVKLCDFGMSREHSGRRDKKTRQKQAMTLCGTQEWMAPEILLHDSFDASVDVYSFGMVLSELMTREIPADCPPGSSSPSNSGLVELFKSCISYEPEQRPDWPEIVAALEKLYAECPGEGKIPGSPMPSARPRVAGTIEDFWPAVEYGDQDPAPPLPPKLPEKPSTEAYKAYMRVKFRYQVLYKKRVQDARSLLKDVTADSLQLHPADVRALFLEFAPNAKYGSQLV